MYNDFLFIFAPKFPIAIIVFVVFFIGFYLLDRYLRTISNKEVIRVVAWLSPEDFKKSVFTGFISTTYSGWGPLTGFPPYNWRVWSWIDYTKGAISNNSKVGLQGISFDVFPGERIFRSLSKTFGPTVSVRGTKEGLSLKDRNPAFYTREANLPNWMYKTRMEDNIFASGLALFGLSYIVVLAPLISIVIFSLGIFCYWLSLKLVKLAR